VRAMALELAPAKPSLLSVSNAAAMIRSLVAAPEAESLLGILGCAIRSLIDRFEHTL
jgi:hypothetical protein